MIDTVLKLIVTDVLPLVLSMAVSFVIWTIVNTLFRRSAIRNSRIGVFWSGLRLPAGALILISAFKITLTQQFPEFSDASETYFRVLFIVVFAWTLIATVRTSRFLLLQLFDLDAEDNLKARKISTQIRVFERILNVVILLVAFSMILISFETVRNLGRSLLASAGIAGVILGVAAQKLLANLLAGFQIAVTQPIRIDDVVIIEEEWGWIEEITLTYVVVRIWDKRRLIIPSSQIIEKPFQNWTRKNSDILGTVYLYADYQLPIEPIRERLTEVLKKSELWDGKVNVLQVTNLTEKTMELRALMSAKNSPLAWDLRVYVREQLVSFIQQEFPSCLPRTRVSLDQ